MTSRPDPAAIREAVNRLVDDYRDRCLWFLRLDYYPQTVDERCRVLDLIVRHGDLEALRRASEIRQWLSPRFSETSADA
jgi:hypothetical protein